MHSLRELNDLLTSKEIEVKEFGGWYLKVGKDTWTMSHDVFYRNGLPQSLREKDLFDKYKKVTNDNQNSKTRKWRGISSRNYRGK